jgi:hypothetical protein
VHTDAIGAAARGDRGKVHDPPALPRLHARRELAADEERGGEVRRQHLRPLGVIDVFEQPCAAWHRRLRVLPGRRHRAARDVDDEVRRAASADPFHFIGAREVGDEHAGPGMDVGGEDLHALGREPLADRLADAAGRPADERLLPLKALKRHRTRR